MSCFYTIVHFPHSELFPELRRFSAIRKKNRPVCTWCFFVTVPSGGGNTVVHIMFFSPLSSSSRVRTEGRRGGFQTCAGGSDRNGHALAPNPQALPPRALCSSDPGTRAIAQGLSGRPWAPDRVRGGRLERMTKHDDSRHLRTLGPSSRPTVREWRNLGSIQETSSGIRRRDSSTTRSCGPLRSE